MNARQHDALRSSLSRPHRFPYLAIVVVLLLVCPPLPPPVLATEGSRPSATIPRSNNRYSQSILSEEQSDGGPNSDPLTAPCGPPWNPSPLIDPSTGYLSQLYRRLPGEWETRANLRGKHGPRARRYPLSLTSVPARVRQVPGDGNCLFHSLAVGLIQATNGTEVPMGSGTDIRHLRTFSRDLRQRAVDVLQHTPRRRLFLQGDEYLEAQELLRAAAAQFDLEGEEYCHLMRKESYWGGGPEIVALCNYLQRPIHIYELIPAQQQLEATDNHPITATDTEMTHHGDSLEKLLRPRSSPEILSFQQPISTQFTLRRMACFGSPKFDRQEPLHVLSADSRFPDIDPCKIRKMGNHFLALFPLKEEDERKKRKANLCGDENDDDDRYRRERKRLKKHALVRGGTHDGRTTSHSNNKREREREQERENDNSSSNNSDKSVARERWDGGKGSWSVKVMDWLDIKGINGDVCDKYYSLLQRVENWRCRGGRRLTPSMCKIVSKMRDMLSVDKYK